MASDLHHVEQMRRISFALEFLTRSTASWHARKPTQFDPQVQCQQPMVAGRASYF